VKVQHRILLTIVLLVFSAVAQKATALDKTLRINIGTEPETLDPTFMRGSPEFKVSKGLSEPLLELNSEGKPIPAAAWKWEVNDRYTSWTFYLRPEARWHNGDPVVAEDWVYSLKRISTPKVAAPYAAMVYSFLKGGQKFYEAGGMESDAPLPGVVAEDPHRLTLILENPTPFFGSVIHMFSWLPVHRKTVEQHGALWWRDPATYVGNGPFRMTGYSPRDKITVSKADTYWDRDSIFFETIIYRTIESETTEDAAFRTGDLDITNSIAIPELPYWRSRPEYYDRLMFGTYYVGFNCSKPPFDDVRVRRAFSMAIDRKLLVERVTRRNEPISQGIVPRGLPSPQGGDYRDQAGDYVPGYDRERARQLLSEAGYGRGQKRFPQIEYLYNTKDEHKVIGEMLQFLWRDALGLDVRLQNVEWGVWLTRTLAAEYDFSRMSWYGDYLDAMTFLELFESTNSQNTSQWKDPYYDSLLRQARLESDAVAREKLLIEAERYLIDEQCVAAPLFTYVNPVLIQPDVKGVHRNALGGLMYTRARRVPR
jgi:oligopeptide transport system substrate-binding protein